MSKKFLSYLSLLPVFVALPLAACRGQSVKEPSAGGMRIITAAAPEGFSMVHLGRPHDVDFELLSGKDGRELFRRAELRTTMKESLRASFVDVADEEGFAAHASAWHLGRIGASVGRGKHYVSRRLVLVSDVVELDETRGPKKAPDRAVYYPFRVYRGWSYEVVCKLGAAGFSTELEQNFLIAEGGIEAFAEEHDLSCQAIGRGVQAKNSESMFASKLEELDRDFRSGAPVPVLVEWRRIEGRVGHGGQEVPLKTGCPGESGCEPCEQWSFSGLSWTIPESPQGGGSWDPGGSPPDVTVTLKSEDGSAVTSGEQETLHFDWHLKTPFLISAGQQLQLVASDRDVDQDDPIFEFRGVVPRYLDEGEWVLHAGQLTMEGTCTLPRYDEPGD
jgi:hypothetical protein